MQMKLNDINGANHTLVLSSRARKVLLRRYIINCS